MASQSRKLLYVFFVFEEKLHKFYCIHAIICLFFFYLQNFPGRSAPIKEQTVIEYILEAAQEGFEMDWTRLCNEIGLTHEMFLDIQTAILKVGSREKLKPIKNELPEDVSSKP